MYIFGLYSVTVWAILYYLAELNAVDEKHDVSIDGTDNYPDSAAVKVIP